MANNNSSDIIVTTAGTQYLTPTVGFKNFLLQGDMDNNPWRVIVPTATTARTGVGAGSSWVTDGIAYNGVGANRMTTQRTADAPTAAEAGFIINTCLHFDVTTADSSIAAGDLAMCRIITGAQLATRLYNTPFTLSFWIKTTITGTYCVNFLFPVATQGYIAEYTVLASNTWEKKTITVPALGTLTMAIAEADNPGLIVNFTFMSGSNYHGTAGSWATPNPGHATSNQVNGVNSTANDIKLTAVQLEIGTSATDFEKLPIDVVRKHCGTWVQKSSIAYGATTSVRLTSPIISCVQTNTTTVDGYVNYESPLYSSNGSNITAVVFDSGGNTGQADFQSIAGVSTARAATTSLISGQGFRVRQAVALDYSCTLNYYAYINSLTNVV